jgi:hypothetical protein
MAILPNQSTVEDPGNELDQITSHVNLSHMAGNSQVPSKKSMALYLDDLTPLFLRDSKNSSSYIALYLIRLIEAQQALPGSCFLLPSLESLSGYFDVHYTEIQKAFRKIKLQGHDYVIPGYYGSISLWTSIKLPSLESDSKSFEGSQQFSNVIFIRTPVT